MRIFAEVFDQRAYSGLVLTRQTVSQACLNLQGHVLDTIKD
jgi:hypothetical protein